MVGLILRGPLLQDSLPVPIRTISALGRCIDIDDWFAGQPTYSNDLLSGAYGEADRDLLIRSGLTSVRIFVEPISLTQTGAVNPSRINLLANSIAKFASDDLFVVVNLADMDSALKSAVYDVLRGLRRRDRLMIQEKGISSLPADGSLAGVTTIQTIASDELEQPPSENRGNVVYAFSVSGPKLFQSQRLGSGERWQARWGALMYPPDASRLRRIASDLEGNAKSEVLEYAKSRWSVEEWRRKIEPFQEWGRRHRRYVWLTDFGCDASADSSSRTEYFRQITAAAGNLRVPWCVGSVSGSYALTRGDASSRTLRSEASALISSSDR